MALRARSASCNTPPRSPILFESPAPDSIHDGNELTSKTPKSPDATPNKAQGHLVQPPPFTEPVLKMRRKRSVTMAEPVNVPAARVDALVKAVGGTLLPLSAGLGSPGYDSAAVTKYPHPYPCSYSYSYSHQPSTPATPWTVSADSGLVYPISSSRPPCDPSQFSAATPWMAHDADLVAPYLSAAGLYAGFATSSSSSSSASSTTSPPPPPTTTERPYGLAPGSAFSGPVNWLVNGCALPMASPPVVPPPLSPFVPAPTFPFVGSSSMRPAATATTTTAAAKASSDKAPRWGVLRQQIQDGRHPKSRGTCKFFNPQTGFGYIIDDRAEELATDVFVHFTGIEQSRGFRCLSLGERVEYFLTQNSAGRVQALKVVGENGAPLLGLADPVQANRVREAARRLSPSIDSGASSDSSASSRNLTVNGRSRKPRIVPIPPSQLPANALGLVASAAPTDEH